MIRFNRDGTKLAIKISHGPLDRVYTMRWECQNEEYAELLTRHFCDTFRAAIKRAREEAYRAGWGDAKSKRAKQTWWSGHLD